MSRTKRSQKAPKSVNPKEDVLKLVPEEQLVYHIKNNSKIALLEKVIEDNSDVDINYLVFPPGTTDDEIENDINLRASDSLLTLCIRFDNIDLIKWLLKHDVDKFLLIESNQTSFHLAAEKNSLEIMKLLLDGENDLDLMELEDDLGRTPFLIALEKHYNSQICSLALEKGTVFSFNQKTKKIEGQRLLIHQVVLEGSIKQFECLINLGDSPFKRDVHSNTILHTLFREDGPDSKLIRGIIEVLLKKFVKLPQTFINAENSSGKTALEMCILEREMFDIAKNLIKIGCNINHISRVTGMTLIHKCACLGLEKIISELSGSFKIKMGVVDKWGCSPIHYCKDEKVLKVLLEKKNEINAQNELGLCPLHVFIITGKNELARIIMGEKRANMKLKNKKMRNMLHLCAKYGRYEILEMFLKKISSSVLKVMIEEEDFMGNTALEVAIEEGKEKIGLLLMEKNANILRKNKNLIQLAVKLKLSEIVFKMIEKESVKNGDIIDTLINEFDEKQRSSLHIAVINNDKKSVKALLSSNNCLIDIVEKENKETPLMISCKNGFDDIALILLQEKASTNFADDKGRIALHYAAKSKNVNVSRILIENGSHINKEDKYGRTPLHEAAASNNAIVINYLIKNNANIEFMDEKGRTPLHVAVLNGSIIATKVLIENGAELNATDNYGYTPLIISSKTRNTDCGRTIIQAFSIRNKKHKV